MNIVDILTYTTTVVHVNVDGEMYIVTHREDADGHLVPVWQVVEEGSNEEVWDSELRPKLIEFVTDFFR